VGLAADTLNEALALARAAGDVPGEAHILTGLGSTRLREGASTAAHDVLSQGRDRARAAHNALAEAHALYGLGEVALDQERSEQAVMLLQQAVDLFRAVGNRIHAARALARLGDAQQAAGHIDAARESRDNAMRLTAHMDPAVSAGLRAKIPAPPRKLP
jgi:tetratricopeptide (TPR) repeat protein